MHAAATARRCAALRPPRDLAVVENTRFARPHVLQQRGFRECSTGSPGSSLLSGGVEEKCVPRRQRDVSRLRGQRADATMLQQRPRRAARPEASRARHVERTGSHCAHAHHPQPDGRRPGLRSRPPASVTVDHVAGLERKRASHSAERASARRSGIQQPEVRSSGPAVRPRRSLHRGQCTTPSSICVISRAQLGAGQIDDDAARLAERRRAGFERRRDRRPSAGDSCAPLIRSKSAPARSNSSAQAGVTSAASGAVTMMYTCRSGGRGPNNARVFACRMVSACAQSSRSSATAATAFGALA